MSTPTPRTDAAVRLTFAAGHNTVCPNFARTLERELAEELERSTHYRDKWQQVTAELAALREDRERLDWLEGNAGDIPKYNSRSFVWFVNQNIRAAIDVSRAETR